MSNYPFKNLVFRGGGILGIAYLGALKVLDSDEYNILSQIERVSGASAGAITALVVSMCKNSDEIKEITDTLDFSKVPDKRGKEIEEKHKLMADFLNIEIDDLFCVYRLIHHYGWFSSAYFYDWLKQTINNQFQKHTGLDKGGLQTFADFKAAGFRDIYVSVTNVSKHKNEIFSFENKPDMPVANAVRMSMSIPLYFNTVKYENDYYADGGTVNNYPMEVFDNSKFVSSKNNFTNGINWETLGCHLFTPKNTKPEKKQKDNLIHYIEDVFLSLLQVQTIEFEKTPNLKARSANISDLGISAIDFKIKKGDKKYQELYKSGYLGMKNYLKNYSPKEIQKTKVMQ